MKTTTIALAILPVFLLLAGCGTDEYESRLKKAASGVNSGSKFSTDLGDEIEVAGSPFKIRLPKALHAVDANDPVRGQCPLLENTNVPGSKTVYEGSIENADTKTTQHFYLYIVTGDLAANFTPIPVWFNLISGKFANLPECSTSVDKNCSVSTPSGGSLQCEEMHFIKIPQKFPLTENGQSKVQEMKGDTIFLCRTEGTKYVALIYRYPSHLSTYQSPAFDPNWIKLVAGTVQSGG